MDKRYSSDPRSVRARRAMQIALGDLLKDKPFQKITVTEIDNRSGLARHTFYNHYETKQDLLNHVIDEILDEFAEKAISLDISWHVVGESIEADQELTVLFFQVWQDHANMVDIFKSVDIDCLLIGRLKSRFQQFFEEYEGTRGLELNPVLGEYFIYYNAYVFAGILRKWFEDEMRFSPESMGEFLDHFSGMTLKRAAIDKFKNSIR